MSAAANVDHQPQPRSSIAVAARAGLVVVCCVGIILRARGLSISFWMDEAWVANSVLSPSLREMFFYPTWLQTTPPGFLLLVRGTNVLLGLSPFALRMVPLVTGIVGVIVVGILATRLLRPPFHFIAVTIVALSPTAVWYGPMLKQYSTELMVGALVLAAMWRFQERPAGRTFAALLATSLVGLTLAYGAVFPVCGAVTYFAAMVMFPDTLGCAAPRRQLRQWLVLYVLAISAVILADYVWLYLPNSSPELGRFWATTAVARPNESLLQQVFRHLVVFGRHAPIPEFLMSLAVVGGSAIVVVGQVWAIASAGTRRYAVWVLSVCGVPFFALLTSTWIGFYPNSPRTSLVVVPALALIVASGAQWSHDLVLTRTAGAFGRIGPFLSGAFWSTVALCLFITGAMAFSAPASPYEDYRSAVTYVGEHVASGDIVYVHACCDEGLKLYRRLDPWKTNPEVSVGRTGEPCCRPRTVVIQQPEHVVVSDLMARVPPHFDGRIWLLYTTRLDYWDYSALQDEGAVLTEALRTSGCSRIQQKAFERMMVSVAECHDRETLP